MSEAENIPEFNWDAHYATIREFGVAPRFEQNGHLFDRQGRYIEPYKNYQPPESPVPSPAEAVQQQRVETAGQTRRDEVMSRAQEKLDGFAAKPDPNQVQAENAAARQAEERNPA